METAIIPFIYNEIRLKEACWINNEPYFTRRAIGEWLEYHHPQERIDGIIRKNPHIDQFSTVLKLTTVDEYERKHLAQPGTGVECGHDSQLSLSCECPADSHPKLRYESPTLREREIETRVYNPIGLQLIVFESRQPKARAFKIAVAHLIYAFMRGELAPPKDIVRHRLYLQVKEALDLTRIKERPIAVKYLAEKAGRSTQTVYRWIKIVERGGDLQRKPSAGKGRYHYLAQSDMQVIHNMVEENPRITVRNVLQNLPGVDPRARWTVYRVKRQFKEQVKQRIIARLEAAGGNRQQGEG